MKTNLLFLCLCLTACQGLVGSGNVVTTERTVAAFRKINIASGIDAKTTTGPQALSIRTDDNLQSAIETFVEGDTLIVRLKRATLIGFDRVDASISNEVFEGVEASGGAHVSIAATPTDSFEVTASGGSEVLLSELTSGDVTIDASGGSDVTLKGHATHGSIVVAGGSTLQLTGVPLESLGLDASGGSTVSARVSSSLTGTVSGGSTVTIVGTPSSRLDNSGGSQVIIGAP